MYEIVELTIDGAFTYWRANSMTRLADRKDCTAEYPYEYQRDCVSCWLGFPHSLRYHERSLESFTGVKVPRFGGGK